MNISFNKLITALLTSIILTGTQCAIAAQGKISVYGDSVAAGVYFTNCNPQLLATVNPSPTERIAVAAGGIARLGLAKAIGGTSLGDLLGDTTSTVFVGGDGPKGFQKLLDNDPSEVIVLRFGGNDANMAVTTNQTASNFFTTMTGRTKRAIDTILAANKIPVIVGVPPLGEYTVGNCFGFTIPNDIWTAKLNMAKVADDALKAEANRQKVLFIDLRNGSIPFSDTPTYALDGIHPNPAASNAISDLIGNKILANLRDIPIQSVATSTQIWPNTALIDTNILTPWSSAGGANPYRQEWLAYWFNGFSSVNYIKLYPRTYYGRSLGFPVDFNIYYSNGSSWVFAKSYTNFQSPRSTAYAILPLPSTAWANGIHVVATKLGADDYNNFYFQLQEVGAGHDLSK